MSDSTNKLMSNAALLTFGALGIGATAYWYYNNYVTSGAPKTYKLFILI